MTGWAVAVSVCKLSGATQMALKIKRKPTSTVNRSLIYSSFCELQAG
jgi:hypothetical protein